MLSDQAYLDACTCARVLRDLIQNLRQCPENKHRAANATALLTYAGLFVEEHYEQILRGVEPYEAMTRALDVLKQGWAAELPTGDESP